ncbi:ferric reductase transmembrane component 5 [Dactylonectria estremocensis]|uniref:Ferric reductase transmembrane component 5 n=1 Tax=Dactylonectria estremocensis TaxID=1079267 RepID=A0A9P9E809_9HYPO|nr:ferric reductase transmembrane component 5 [Dactylonectria estremocensis]
MNTVPPGEKPILPRQLINEWNLTLYAGVLLGLISLFTVVHWSRHLATRYRFSSSRTLRRLPGFRILLRASRSIRGYAVIKVPGFPSLGHAILVTFYLILNVVLSLIYIEWDRKRLNNPGARLGWMAAANIALSVFFGLRSTPLGFMSAQTYNHLNVLHRAIGYTAIAQMLLHALLYALRFGLQHRISQLFTKPANLHGVVSGVGMLILLFGLLRHRGYEAFYISHVFGAIVTIFFAALHRPFWYKKIPVIMVFAGSMWALDRLIRLATVVFNVYGNKATIYPLPNNGVRLVLKRRLIGASPGSHCFVWIPGIRVFESHPFTIVSNTALGLELVIKPYKGFTKDIQEYAISKPGTKLRASIEGPYGSLPNLQHYDRILFIAGGSGAAFTFGLVNNLLSKLEPESPQLVDFIWTVRERGNLSWFAEHLQKLAEHLAQIIVTLHITGQSNVTTPEQGTPLGGRTPTLRSYGTFFPQINHEESVGSMHRLAFNPKFASAREEACSPQPVESLSLGDMETCFNVKYERLRTSEAIFETVKSVGTNQRVLIAACGPLSLMNDVNTAAGACIRSDGPSVEVHCENFDI